MSVVILAALPVADSQTLKAAEIGQFIFGKWANTGTDAQSGCRRPQWEFRKSQGGGVEITTRTMRELTYKATVLPSPKGDSNPVAVAIFNIDPALTDVPVSETPILDFIATMPDRNTLILDPKIEGVPPHSLRRCNGRAG